MVEFVEKTRNNIVEQVLDIGRNGKYDLIVIGKGRCPSTMVTSLAEHDILSQGLLGMYYLLQAKG